jgi:hypothetical protein
MKRLWLLVSMIALCGALAAHGQDATPAVPFAQTPEIAPLTLLENDSRADLCRAPLMDSFVRHIVRPGDTLPRLLRQSDDFTPTQIAVMNCIDDPSALPVGAAIFLPPGDDVRGPVDPLALFALWRFTLANACDHEWIGGFGAAPRCPDEPARTVYAAYQPFERGAMIWFSDTQQIVILNSDGTFSVVSDVYEEGMPEPPLTPPDGLRTPVRGFRLVWEWLGGADSPLGWATADEIGFDSARQPAGRVSYTTYIALPEDAAIALTEIPNAPVGFWSDGS